MADPMALIAHQVAGTAAGTLGGTAGSGTGTFTFAGSGGMAVSSGVSGVSCSSGGGQPHAAAGLTAVGFAGRGVGTVEADRKRTEGEGVGTAPKRGCFALPGLTRRHEW